MLAQYLMLLCNAATMMQIWGHPVADHSGSHKGDALNSFVFELPKTDGDSSNLLSRVTSLSASGRSYGQPQPSRGQGRSILSTPDKDAITYPDDLIRDSYGNIVKPYVPLLDSTGAASSAAGHHAEIGLLTDVNKAGGSGQPSLPFVVPSYASGILTGSATNGGTIKAPQTDLLPPLSSGNYNYPTLSGAKPSALPLPNVHQNEVSSSYADSAFGVTAPALSAKLPGPIPSSTTTAPKPNANYATAPQPPTNTFTGSAPPPPPPPQPQLPSNAYQQPDQIPVYIQIQPAFGGSQPPTTFGQTIPVSTPTHSSANKNVQPPSFAPNHGQSSTPTAGKYTGGFGGAPGVLGNQPKPGYAVTPAAGTPSTPAVGHHLDSQRPTTNYGGGVQQVAQPTAPAHNHVGTSYGAAPTQSAPPSGSLGQPTTGNNGSYGSSHGASAHPAKPTASGSDGKYTGGFGGPPGHLSPYDNAVGPTASGHHHHAGPNRKY